MKWPLVPLQRVVLVNPKDDDHKGLSDDTPVSFVSMSAVSENGFGITERIVKPLGDVRRGCSAFKNNDVLFAKITPCMENGKSAVATGLRMPVASDQPSFTCCVRVRLFYLTSYTTFSDRSRSVY